MSRTIPLIALIFALSVACDSDPGQSDDADDPTDDIVVIDEEPSDDEAQSDENIDHGDDDHELADDLDAGETGHFGDDFSSDDAPIDLVDALDMLESSDDGSIEVKVLAQSTEVCENRGCWMNLYHAEEDLPVRVYMQNYGFFVPRNATGAEAIVEGTMTFEELSEEDAIHHAEHIADQTDLELDEIELETRIVQLKARGIQMTMPEG